MIALQMKSSRDFMGKLLTSDCFDHFLMPEAQIVTANSYTIDGHIQKDFYTHEEWENGIGKEMISDWKGMRPVIHSLIRGKHTPVRFQIMLQLSAKDREDILPEQESGDINALLCTIRYEKGQTVLVSGAAYRTFSMDKEPERIWEKSLKSFLTENHIEFEEN